MESAVKELIGMRPRLARPPSRRDLRASGTRERYYCNFGISPEKSNLPRCGELRVTGSDAEEKCEW
jgi:hypothetical protein